jgi:hypothetical protein
MAYSKYTPHEIAYLLSNPDEFIKVHKLDRNSALTLRRYYIKKVREIEMEGASPQNINANEVADLLKPVGGTNPEDYDISYHVGYIKNAEGEIEYTKPLPSVRPRSGRQTQQLSDFVSQADPVRITPSKRKPAVRDHRLIVAFSDSQIDYRRIDGVDHPIHDERALNVVRMICKAYQPDTIVNLGDTVDLSALSRFDKDSDHFDHSMQPAFNRVHRMYAELRADNPQSRIVEVDSNHNTRLKKFMLKNASQLYGLRQAGVEEEYPAMSYPFLANLRAVDVEWISGYGGAEFVYGEEYDAPPIVFKHGMSSGTNVSGKEASQNPYTHIVRGHTHRPEMTHRTMRNGHYLTYMIVGVTCSITGDVPSVYSSVDDRNQVVRTQEKWQQGLAVIIDHLDGEYEFHNILIKDGVARFNGKAYDGNVQD